MNYVREFIEVTQDQQGYNLLGKEVKGTCKFEVLDDKIKVKVKINNLKKLRDGLKYSVHMIKVSDDKSVSVQIGDLKVDKFGRAELNYQKNSDEGRESQIIRDFNVLALIIKDEKGFDNLTTPAIGYRKNKILWRHNFTTVDEKIEELKKFHVDLNEGDDNANEQVSDQPVLENVPEDHMEDKDDNTEEEVQTFKGIPIDELEQRDDYEVVKDEEGNAVMVKRYIDIDPACRQRHNIKENEEAHDKDTHDEYAHDEYAHDEDAHDEDAHHEYTHDDIINNEKTERLETVSNGINDNDEKLEDSPAETVKHTNIKLNRFSRRADEMFNTYPKLYPFQNAGDQEMWIRVEPRDVVIFPINTWQMMNNPFLLTGYYKHHHLLLGEKLKETGERYYLLAVPSQYNSRQKRIANIHGFEYFRSCRDIQPRTGEFGYWIKEINV